jgi:sarcosine oxidase
VILLERFDLGHAHGSSHGTSRIFRLNYPDEQFVRMAQAAADAWRELEAQRGQTLIERTGSVDIGPVATETARAPRAECPSRRSTPRPSATDGRFDFEPHETAIFQPDSGITFADRAHGAFLTEAAEAGVEIRERSPARALALERRGVHVTMDEAELSAMQSLSRQAHGRPSSLTTSGSCRADP